MADLSENLLDYARKALSGQPPGATPGHQIDGLLEAFRIADPVRREALFTVLAHDFVSLRTIMRILRRAG
jgi:hypothetical protein